MGYETSSPSPQRRTLCTACDRPLPVCLCHVLPNPRIPTSTQLIIVQHPHEARHKLSTVPVISKCLLNSTTIVARRLRPGLSPLLDTHPNAVYLFPSTPNRNALRLDQLNDAFFEAKFTDLDNHSSSKLKSELDPKFVSAKLPDPDENSSSKSKSELDPEFFSEKLRDPNDDSSSGLESEFDPEFVLRSSCDLSEILRRRLGKLKDLSEPDENLLPKLVLIAFDATWKHAKEMVSASEDYLSRFAVRVCLDTDESVDGGSIYDSELVLRKEPFGGCVSTMEAVARCLRVVERNGVEIEGVLVGVLREMVRLQAGFLRPMKPRVKLSKRGKQRDTIRGKIEKESGLVAS